MESDQDYDHLDVFASHLKVETAMNSSYESEADDDGGGGTLEFEILSNLDVLKQQTKQIFQESRDYKKILKEKDDKIKVLMDLNLTLQLENRELKQKLEGNTSNYDSSLSKNNSIDCQEVDDEDALIVRASPASVVHLINKKQLFNLSIIDGSEGNDSKYIQKLLFSLYTQEEINGISVSGKPTKNPKYITANQTACKPISIAKLQYIYYMMDERVDKSGSIGKDEMRRKSRQLINKFINRAIQFVKRTRKKREERNQSL